MSLDAVHHQDCSPVSGSSRRPSEAVGYRRCHDTGGDATYKTVSPGALRYGWVAAEATRSTMEEKKDSGDAVKSSPYPGAALPQLWSNIGPYRHARLPRTLRGLMRRVRRS
jgi:hypothetical protein